ncbi:MAG: hypothetical protein MK137_04130 [Rickettsiales bacterium]|nr:hypothetical protein [Rickettsiales bacterium]
MPRDDTQTRGLQVKRIKAKFNRKQGDSRLHDEFNTLLSRVKEKQDKKHDFDFLRRAEVLVNRIPRGTPPRDAQRHPNATDNTTVYARKDKAHELAQKEWVKRMIESRMQQGPSRAFEA